MKKTMTTAVLLAASLLGQAASAGELQLFSREGFRGEQVVLQGGANDFREFGFNDRASSVVVLSGTWELCEHKNFQGTCAVFERGEYPDLRRFNNSFSSAREIERRRGWGNGRDERWREERREERRYDRDDQRWREDQRPSYAYGGNQGGYRPDAVELFNDNALGGRRVAVNNDIRTLRDVGFNDNANSMIINEGTWELCEHADYQGQCRVYGPGRYNSLQDFSDRVSSLRRIR